MNLFGAQMHRLTAVLICLETILFFIQLYHFLSRPNDTQRGLYLVLLFLLLHFNLANGLFPDLAFPLNIKFQYMALDGIAYLIGAYFPFYFYKVFRLKELRFYATWGVALFVLLPYAMMDVVYAVNGKLMLDREIGVLIPALFGLVVLAVMFHAIRRKVAKTGNRQQYWCELMVWTTLLPWEAMSVFAFYPAPQWLRVLFANLGWVVITLLGLTKGIRLSRREHRHYRELTVTISPQDFAEGCRLLGLSEREIDVALLRLEGLERQAIADKLFISFHTVKTHVTNSHEKTGARNLRELIKLAKQALDKQQKG